LFIWELKGERGQLEQPRETEFLVRIFLRKVLSFDEDRADNRLFTAVH
jgi:hypothetical protein